MTARRTIDLPDLPDGYQWSSDVEDSVIVLRLRYANLEAKTGWLAGEITAKNARQMRRGARRLARMAWLSRSAEDGLT